MTSTTTAAASASGAGDVSSHATQPRRAGLSAGSSRAHTVRSNDGGRSIAPAVSSIYASTRCSRAYSERQNAHSRR